MILIGTRWRVPVKDRKKWDDFKKKVLGAPGINEMYKKVTREKAQAALKRGST